jgi:hypothetical protein
MDNKVKAPLFISVHLNKVIASAQCSQRQAGPVNAELSVVFAPFTAAQLI